MINKSKKIYNEHLFDQDDFDVLKEELKIEMHAQQQGSMNQPPSGHTSPDLYEKQIFSFFNDKLSFIKHEIHSKLSVYTKIANKLTDITQFLIESKYASTDFEQNITTLIEKYKHHIDEIKRDLKIKQNDLQNFKIQNHLYREASYPESRIFNVSIILFIILIETMLNSYFFAQGNELGLLGGASQAIIISVVNIALAFFVGNVLLRYLYVTDKIKKYGAVILISFIIAVLFTFNLLVGHLRIFLVSNPETAYQDSILSFREHPLQLTDFNSILLVVLGIIIFLIATIDFFKMDDAFPKYGELDRKYKDVFNEYTELKENLLNELDDLTEHSHKELENKQNVSKTIMKEVEDIPIYRQRLHDQYQQYYNYLNETYKTMIALYQDINRESRGDDAPIYFGKTDELDEKYMIDCIDPNLQKQIAKLNKDMREYPHIIGDQKSKINQIVKDTILELHKNISLDNINA
jgi:hypothetical protein